MLLKRTVLNYWMQRISIYCETLQATIGLDSEGKTGIPNCKKVKRHKKAFRSGRGCARGEDGGKGIVRIGWKKVASH